MYKHRWLASDPHTYPQTDAMTGLPLASADLGRPGSCRCAGQTLRPCREADIRAGRPADARVDGAAHSNDYFALRHPRASDPYAASRPTTRSGATATRCRTLPDSAQLTADDRNYRLCDCWRQFPFCTVGFGQRVAVPTRPRRATRTWNLIATTSGGVTR